MNKGKVSNVLDTMHPDYAKCVVSFCYRTWWIDLACTTKDEIIIFWCLILFKAMIYRSSSCLFLPVFTCYNDMTLTAI